MKLRYSEREINGGASLAINALQRTHTLTHTTDLLICLWRLSKLYWYLCISFKWLW